MAEAECDQNARASDKTHLLTHPWKQTAARAGQIRRDLPPALRVRRRQIKSARPQEFFALAARAPPTCRMLAGALEALRSGTLGVLTVPDFLRRAVCRTGPRGARKDAQAARARRLRQRVRFHPATPEDHEIASPPSARSRDRAEACAKRHVRPVDAALYSPPEARSRNRSDSLLSLAV